MSWQDRSRSLVKRHGQATTFAARTILEHAVPGNHAIVELVGQAFTWARGAKKSSKVRRTTLHETSADLDRLDRLLEVLEGDPGCLMTRLAQLQYQPVEVEQVLERSIAGDQDARVGLAVIVALAKRFDRARLPLAGPTDRLLDFPLRDGLRYGYWCLWIKDSGIGLLLVNHETGTFVRIWPSCNGWFEYRTARVTPGKIYTVWSAGGRSLDPGRYLNLLDNTGPPRWRLPEGTYPAEQWNVEVKPARMTLEHPSTRRQLFFERDRPVWDCNDALWNEPAHAHA